MSYKYTQKKAKGFAKKKSSTFTGTMNQKNGLV